MQSSPHRHTVQLTTKYSNCGPWLVKYGDTTVRVGWWTYNPDQDQIERAVKKAVKRHDEGSIRAGKEQEQKRSFQAIAEDVVDKESFAPKQEDRIKSFASLYPRVDWYPQTKDAYYIPFKQVGDNLDAGIKFDVS